MIGGDILMDGKKKFKYVMLSIAIIELITEIMKHI